ncbi:hypothetical protein NC651_006209 [Populus alba x Populus x berolinensis]|nr:hypothetical protein NC651_006209 [Populus alba x Populus x berolinensis]
MFQRKRRLARISEWLLDCTRLSLALAATLTTRLKRMLSRLGALNSINDCKAIHLVPSTSMEDGVLSFHEVCLP